MKVKFQMGQYNILKQIFCKFAGQFDLEGQGQKSRSQGHKFLE